MGRLDYQRLMAVGSVLDIGCGEANLNGILHAVRIDRMDYHLPGQLIGDAEDLPFLDKAFDSSILGDMLEHVYDPLGVLQGSCRGWHGSA